MIVFLHGNGERGDGSPAQLPRVLVNGPPKLINQGKFPASFTVGGEKFSFIVISPQNKEKTNYIDGIDSLIKYCVKNYRVDEDRVYLTGLSLGGYQSWRYTGASRANASRIASLLLVCGGVAPRGQEACNIATSGIAMWATNNSGDTQAKPWQMDSCVKSVNTCNPMLNPKAKLTIFNANGHDAWSKTYDPGFKEDGMNVYEWMLSHKKGGVSAPPPVADAGANQTITLPVNSVVLDGTKSTAPTGTISSYSWTKLSGPSTGAIATPTGSKTTVTNLSEGSYQFQLKVTDSKGSIATAVVTIKVNPAPLPPVADAGSMQIITLPVNNITLDGTKSSAPSGSITAFQWTKVSGPPSGSIVNATSSTTQVTGLTEGVYTFQLKITDSNGGSSVATVSITVNAAPVPPIADAGNDQTIDLPNNTIILDGSGSLAPSGNIVDYKWTKLSGPSGENISSPSGVSTEVNGLKKGTYEFELKITDNNGMSATSSVVITVNAAPQPPVANAGENQIITLPDDGITLDGSASAAPGDMISGYQWRQVDGSSDAVISDAGKAVTAVNGLREGIYKFELEVTNSKGLSSSSIVIITVKAAPLPPTANAGFDQSIILPDNSIALDGSLSVALSGTISEYSWTKKTGPEGETITSPNDAKTTVTELSEGLYIFELRITDNNGLSSTASVTITVKAAPLPPVADAGADKTITLPTNQLLLDGTGSNAPSGTISSYHWRLVSGAAGYTISSPESAKTSVTGLVDGMYIFELKVTDDNGLSSTASVSVTVKPAPLPPVANAGLAQTIVLPDNVIMLDGSQSVAGSGAINHYQWSKLSGPSGIDINSPENEITAVTGFSEGIYTFSLKVTDDNGLSSTASVIITVKPALLPPIADAGADKTIVLPEGSIVLDGNSSTGVSGAISSFEWNKISGPEGEDIVSPNDAVTIVKGLQEGVYQFKLKVTDGNGLSAESIVTITVNQEETLPPVAAAGDDQVITLPVDFITLDGSSSMAQSGELTNFKWTKLSGPEGAVISIAEEKITQVTNLTEGVYKFQLTVTDDKGGSSTASVSVTVKPAPLPPVADAGTAQTIELPDNQVTLDGSASTAPSGNISKYQWNKMSGPEGEIIAVPESAITIVNDLHEGTYEFELKIEDDHGNSSTASVVVIVKPAPLPPVADAGMDQAVTLPVNTVSLNGSASTASSGVISSYKWRKTSGPDGAIINTPESAVTTVDGLTQGIYIFELTVEDSGGRTSTALIMVTVNAAPLPPVADAGDGQTITLPSNSVILDGSASEAISGSVSTYNWTKISGPEGAVIATAESVQTTVNNLTEGTYIFELKITDSNGETSSALVTIVVKPAPLPPIADAGGARTITLPVDSVQLDGSGSASISGAIKGYEWTKTSGPSGSVIIAPSSVITVVKGLSQGVYTFELKVTDDNGVSSTSSVVITVEAASLPPVASAGNAQTITLPNGTIILDGSASSASEGNTITSYHWNKVAGPLEGMITDESAVITEVTGLKAGVYIFQLEVTDSRDEKATATVTVTVESAPPPPVAVAGNDQTVRLPVNTVNLDGSKSSAPGGTIIKFEWSKVSGPSGGDIANPLQAKSEVDNLQEGKYQFRLKIADNNGVTSSATVFVTVQPAPLPPVANAGNAQSVTLPVNVVTLDGSGSSASEGEIKTYTWSKVSGPAAGTIKNASKAVTAIEGLAAGTYVFQLKVTDHNGNSNTATVTVVVKPAPIVPPVADAGADISIQLPLSSAIGLDGSQSYARSGEIKEYRWEKISGPGSLIILNSNSPTPSIQDIEPGEYVFRLTVEDAKGLSATDEIRLTVVDEAVVLPPPVANAGESRTISLTDEEVFLDGGSSYARFGTITGYNWVMLSGPSKAKIEYAESDLALVSEFVAGEYLFELTVTDNTGKTDKATVKITVANTGARKDLSPLIKVFPNPVRETASVELQGPAKGRTGINIYDVNGKLVFKREFIKDDIYVNQQIDMSGLLKGVYFIEVLIDYQYRSVMKIIKM
ncbi:MAG: PKD domain-containing protein [Chitinophagaceae bacterium]|nr:PKD domain-containing protein [Chitinophagaceae bacterium]